MWVSEGCVHIRAHCWLGGVPYCGITIQHPSFRNAAPGPPYGSGEASVSLCYSRAEL